MRGASSAGGPGHAGVRQASRPGQGSDVPAGDQRFELVPALPATQLKGSEHNDAFLPSDDGRLRTTTNNSGGIQGGIGNGEPIVIRVAFKPCTIRKEQQTINDKATTLAAKGRRPLRAAKGRADGGGDGESGAR